MKVNQNPLSHAQSGGVQSGAQSVGTKQVEKAKGVEKSIEAKKPHGEASPSAANASQVEISEQARLMRQATEAVNALPDVRTDRIADLKERIRAGTYKVDSASVADRLVEEHFLTDFGKNNA